MEIVHTETDSLGITYTLAIEPDDMEIRGNAMASGDDAADTALENELIARLENGDTWAWAQTKCTATVDGIDIKGVDYLGCCSYRDTADFIAPGGYWNDMKTCARGVLIANMERAIESTRAIRKALAKLRKVAK